MASLGYTDAWAKANDGAFRHRLRVALTRHCQYQIQRDQNTAGGESVERYEALQALARVALMQVRQADWLTSAGLYVLLPWNMVGPSVDDDEALDARIGAVFPELGSGPIVSP